MPGMKPKVGPKKGMVKRMRGGGMAAKPPGMRNGGMAKKEVPEANKGLAKLPKNVRNKMGFMADGGAVKRNGGAVKKTAKGGAAVRSSSAKSL